MADRMAIPGGEPYDKWIERGGTAQYLFEAYLNKWPEGTAACLVVGDDFYVRFHDGKMRYVDYVGDFDNEAGWCAQCGVPVDIDSRECYRCDAVLCGHCGGGMTGARPTTVWKRGNGNVRYRNRSPRRNAGTGRPARHE